MQFTWGRAAAIAALTFAAIFLLRFLTVGPGNYLDGAPGEQNAFGQLNQAQSFELSRKNYASAKQMAGGAPPATALADNQKYEKVGSLAQVTKDFDADRTRTFDLIAANSGIVQQERATGQKGRRLLQLGIGVPPDNFDAFIEAAMKIGKGTSIDIVKNDKTNEYLQLRARRQTLEKARTALEELRAGGGSTEERVTVQNRLTEIEQQIQDLGVSLGEFDSQNELCTVKLSLTEKSDPLPWSARRRAFQAFQLALTDYLMLGTGFFALTLGLWIASILFQHGRRLLLRQAAS